MKFIRQAKIFDGRMDLAPLAGTLFLLVIFLILASLVYTPGIPFRMEPDVPLPGGRMMPLTVLTNGTTVFNGKTNRADELESLREEFKELTEGDIVRIQAADDVPARMIAAVCDLAKGLPMALDASSVPIRLPEAGGMTSASGPLVTVSVNLGGQFFFENRLVRPAELRTLLEQAARRSPEPPTLLVMADKSASCDVLLQLRRLALEAGIRNMLLAARPAKP